MDFRKIIPYVLLLGALTLVGCGNKIKKPISENLYFGIGNAPISNVEKSGRGYAIFWPDGRITTSSEDQKTNQLATSGSGLEATVIGYEAFRKNIAEEKLAVSGLSGLGDYSLTGTSIESRNLLNTVSENDNSLSLGLGGLGAGVSNNLGYIIGNNLIAGISSGGSSYGIGLASSLGNYNNPNSLAENEGIYSNSINESKMVTSKVPEPGTLALWGMGFVSLLGLKRFRRK